jgi:hypothetical protein
MVKVELRKNRPADELDVNYIKLMKLNAGWGEGVEPV